MFDNFIKELPDNMKKSLALSGKITDYISDFYSAELNKNTDKKTICTIITNALAITSANHINFSCEEEFEKKLITGFSELIEIYLKHARIEEKENFENKNNG